MSDITQEYLAKIIDNQVTITAAQNFEREMKRLNRQYAFIVDVADFEEDDDDHPVLSGGNTKDPCNPLLGVTMMLRELYEEDDAGFDLLAKTIVDVYNAAKKENVTIQWEEQTNE